MHNNVELLSALVNPKKYFEHILDLKIGKYLKNNDSNTSMIDYPYDLKLLCMGAFNDTNISDITV